MELFARPDAHPLMLHYLVQRKWGPESLLWEQETLVAHIEEGGGKLRPLNLHRLQAARVLASNPMFWECWDVFCRIAPVLDGLAPEFHDLVPPTAGACLVAADIAAQIDPDRHYAPEVAAFVGVIWEHEGLRLPLPPCEWAHLDDPGWFGDTARLRVMWPEIRNSRKIPASLSPIDRLHAEHLLGLHDHLLADRALRAAQEKYLV